MHTDRKLIAAASARTRKQIGTSSIVFVGLMGAGKSAIGRMSAQALNLPFVDSDHEIEAVSRMSITDLFASYGEDEFRSLEARVIERLLADGPRVVSTGGGAFINEKTRALIKERGVSIWLDGDLEVLWDRVKKRNTRPLLKTANPKETLAELMRVRNPTYAEADITVRSRDVPKEVVVGEVLQALAEYTATDGKNER